MAAISFLSRITLEIKTSDDPLKDLKATKHIEHMKLYQLSPTHSHLYGADDGGEQADHAQELHSAQVLYSVLLTHIRDSIQSRADQNQAVPQQNICSCRGKRTINT